MVFAWNDAWRKHPLLYNQKLSVGLILPGFWWGAGAFAVYHGFTKFQNYKNGSKDHGHGDHGHGHAEHADEAHGAAASHH